MKYFETNLLGYEMVYTSSQQLFFKMKNTCTFPRVTDICANQVKTEKVKTKPKYIIVTRFSKLLRSAPQSSLKIVCETPLRNNNLLKTM